jgi:hypothetical protein
VIRTDSAVASAATSVLSPSDDGKYAFFAATRSSALSSPSPSVSETSSKSSSEDASPACSSGVSAGIRKPVRYQFDGRTRRGRRSWASS